MIFKHFWKEEFSIDEIEITANPKNRHLISKIEKGFEHPLELPVINPKNSSTLKIPLNNIEVIKAFAHQSKIHAIKDDEVYFLQKRLKELSYLEKYNFQRINNSTILNLSRIKSFSAIEYARLEVETFGNHSYIVSRHYAKEIKERLL